jgi:hypothetical protein
METLQVAQFDGDGAGVFVEYGVDLSVTAITAEVQRGTLTIALHLDDEHETLMLTTGSHRSATIPVGAVLGIDPESEAVSVCHGNISLMCTWVNE